MARLLALDWDERQLYLVSASTGRGGMRVERAVVWQEEQDLTVANAEEAGRRLRDRLKTSGIAPAPVLVCVGRDRVVLKEIQYPPVPESEEAGLVRFQATKELSEAPEDVVIDYTILEGSGFDSRRVAMAVIVRRELPDAYQALCRAAGLKLLAITPRPFGVAAVLDRSVGVPHLGIGAISPGAVVAVLTIGERWAELCVVQNKKVLFARSLGVGDNLAGEVRRNLALFASQPGSATSSAPESLFVAGNGEVGPLRERLHQMLAIPVHPLDPFAREERLELSSATRGGFTGAVGLLQTWALRNEAAINFVKPKEPRKVGDPDRGRKLVLAAVGIVALVIALFVGSLVLANKRDQVSRLTELKDSLDQQLRLLAQDEKDIKALRDWEQAKVPWLDELYDLAARFPYKEGLRVTSLTVDALTVNPKSKVKDPYVARMTIKGQVPGKLTEQIRALAETINNDPHAKAQTPQFKGSGETQEFLILVDLKHQPLPKYETRLVPRRPPSEDDEIDPGFFGGLP